METRVPPPLIDGLALLFVLLLWRFAPGLQINFPLTTALIFGGIIISLGLGLTLAAIGLFKRKDTTILPFKPEKTSALVTTGIYNFTRNPMYLGMSLVILGAIFMTRQPLGIIAMLAAAAYLTKFQIIPEERALEESFGTEYVAYKSRVRRWI